MGKEVFEIKATKYPNQKEENKEGASVITMFFLAMLTVVVVFSLAAYFSYEINQNRFVTTVSKTMDKILVAGQLTSDDRDELLEALEGLGMKDSNLIDIQGSPVEAFDFNDATFAKRGTTITLTIIYNKPHYIANVIAMMNPGVDKEKYRIGHKMTGMSEKL